MAATVNSLSYPSLQPSTFVNGEASASFSTILLWKAICTLRKKVLFCSKEIYGLGESCQNIHKVIMESIAGLEV
ncbi:hypothetical protein ACET3Z_024768 [Daucus carota]